MIDDARQAWLAATRLAPEAERRVLDRVSRAPAPRRSVGWALVPALAAVGALVWARLPEPAATLPLAHVALQLDGAGEVRGTRSRPEIAWESGRLAVEVEPGQGVHLTVATAEATVEVVGTAFTVDRAHHGTAVAVTHGTVRLRCAGQGEVPLGADQHQTCLPADPPTLLLRLAELADAGAPAEERLTTADRALSAPELGSLRPEVLAHRVRALTDLGRTDDALAAAEAYLATGDAPRRAALIEFVARTRYGREQCGALPALERAAAELPPGQERLLLAACLVQADPARAKALTEGAEAWASGKWLDLARELRGR